VRGCGDAHPSGTCASSKQQLKCCSCGCNHTANYRGCSKWKEARAVAAKRAQGERGQKDGVSSRLSAPKSAIVRLFPEQEKLGPGWNLVVRGGRVEKAKATTEYNLNPSGVGGQTTGRIAPAVGQSKPSHPGTPVVVPQPPQPKHTDSSHPQPQSQSALEAITNLLDNLPTSACVDLTRRLLSTASPLPTEDARPRAVLKTVIIFFADHGGAA
jgi:hypothetical protein